MSRCTSEWATQLLMFALIVLIVTTLIAHLQSIRLSGRVAGAATADTSTLIPAARRGHPCPPAAAPGGLLILHRPVTADR